MKDLSIIPTKELKQQLNTVLGEIEYDTLLSEYNRVAPYLVELLKRGYVSTARFSNVNFGRAAEDSGNGLLEYKLPTYVTYQTPFSNEVDYLDLDIGHFGGNVDREDPLNLLQSAKCYPDGKCEGGGFLNWDGDRVKSDWVVLEDGKLPLSFLLSNQTAKPHYAFSTFDQLYGLAKDVGMANSALEADDPTLKFKLKVLSDEEVANLFSIPKDEAKYYFVLGLRHPSSPNTIVLSKSEFDTITSLEDGLFRSLRYDRPELEKMNALKPVDSQFGDFIGVIKDSEPPSTWYYLQDGVNVKSINKSEFDKKYSKLVQEKPSEPKQEDEPKSNALWWIVGGVAVSSAVYFAHSRRKSSY